MPLIATHTGLSPEAYEFIAGLVYEHSRIRLGPDKQALVTGRLGKRLRQLGLDSFDAYCAVLRSPRGDEEIEQLVDMMSTNHTHFFREAAHLDFLRDHILPEMTPRLARKREPLRVWSAASSSGEEPYTIAIVLAEFARLQGGLDWRIEGSDISTRILATARAGIYAAERVKLPEPELLPRYFQRGTGANSGHYRVKDALRKAITFHHLNLLQPTYPVAREQHVIFCRNVMIYFDQETQQQLVAKLVRQLAPGGYLIVGHSESLMGVRHGLKQVKPAVYRSEEC
ncbi:MAG: protein-glutamate O-methyltransferase CheR [Chthoniobacteraceae bacterium]